MNELLENKIVSINETLDEQASEADSIDTKEIKVLTARGIGRRACHALGVLASMMEFSYPAGDKHITRF